MERKIINDLYGGIGYSYTAYDTSLDSFESQNRTSLNGLTFSLSVDKRDNVHYPRNGLYTNVFLDVFPEWIGNTSSTQKVEFDYNHYLPFKKSRDVLAMRFFAGVGLGNISFNEQFTVGDQDIRGYLDGKYRGNQIMAAQGAYCWNFYKKFGAVGFAGVATIFDGINAEHDGKILPSIGTGLRYKISGDLLSFGVDVASGIDDWGIYFRISEAF